MVLYHLNIYPLGLVSTYLGSYHGIEEYFIALANYCCVSNYLICVERSFFRNSASCCSCCVHVVVAEHDYQNRNKVSTSSSSLPKAVSDLSGGSRRMQFL